MVCLEIALRSAALGVTQPHIFGAKKNTHVAKKSVVKSSLTEWTPASMFAHSPYLHQLFFQKKKQKKISSQKITKKISQSACPSKDKKAKTKSYYKTKS